MQVGSWPAELITIPLGNGIANLRLYVDSGDMTVLVTANSVQGTNPLAEPGQLIAVLAAHLRPYAE